MTNRVLAVLLAILTWTPVAQANDWSAGVTYRYDGVGNIKEIGTDRHVYDWAVRIVQSDTNGVRRTFEYDAYGNRTKCLQTGGTDCQYTWTINPDTNRIEHATYDTAGNVTQFDGHSYEYDAFNMQTRDTQGSLVVAEYIYTANDERIAVYVPDTGAWRWSLRDASGKVLREMTSRDPAPGSGGTVGTASWNWVKDYIYRDGLLLASRQLESGATTPSTYHYHLDHLGTPRRITDDSGRIVGAHNYHAFGPELSDGRKNEPTPSRLKYTGHERDGELDYMHARYYDPKMGRFLSVDPTWESADLGKPQSWNRYAYVRNNPINLTDPDGRIPIWLDVVLEVLDGGGPMFEADMSRTAHRPDLTRPAAPRAVVTQYQVDTFDKLKANSVPGDKIDIHHAPQAKPAGQVIPNYDPQKAPAIAVPQREHQKIPTQKGSHTGSPRDLVAKDVRDLRNHTKAPNSALQKLVKLVKETFPEAMKKIFF